MINILTFLLVLPPAILSIRKVLKVGKKWYMQRKKTYGITIITNRIYCHRKLYNNKIIDLQKESTLKKVIFFFSDIWLVLSSGYYKYKEDKKRKKNQEKLKKRRFAKWL